MKRLFLLCIVLLSACATKPQGYTAPQVVAQVCPPIQSTIIGLQVIWSKLTIVQQSQVSTISKLINPICENSKIATIKTIQDIETQVMPVLASAIRESALSDQEKSNINVGLVASQFLINSTAIGVVPIK